MYLDAEDRKKELLEQNRVSDGMMFKLDWDPRIIGNKIVDGKQVTGIGEKIRSESWDEWPQFFNILRGQMSLVGTRPPKEVVSLPPRQFEERLKSILQLLGASQRFVEDYNAMDVFDAPLDYEMINKKLDYERERTFAFLRSAIEC